MRIRLSGPTRCHGSVVDCEVTLFHLGEAVLRVDRHCTVTLRRSRLLSEVASKERANGGHHVQALCVPQDRPCGCPSRVEHDKMNQAHTKVGAEEYIKEHR